MVKRDVKSVQPVRAVLQCYSKQNQLQCFVTMSNIAQGKLVNKECKQHPHVTYAQGGDATLKVTANDEI